MKSVSFFLILLLAIVAADDGEAFLDAKAAESDVITLPSGLLYKVIEEGPPDGKNPLIGTLCSVHYRGTFIDGTEFDSSYKRGMPGTFSPLQVILGWREALQLMREGDKWELYIPPELAYGNRSVGPIKPNSVLVFVLELLEVPDMDKMFDIDDREL